MGIEQAIAELNQNIVAFNANIEKLLSANTQVTGEAETVSKKKATSSEKKAEAEPVATPEPKEEVVAAEPESANLATYDDVKQVIINLSKSKGRDAAVAVLQRHGAAKVPDLNEEQYASVVSMANRTLSGEYDPEGGE